MQFLNRVNNSKTFAIVPAAGRGERLQSVTAGGSKLLIQIQTSFGPRTVIGLSVERLMSSGLFERVLIPVRQEFRAAFSDELRGWGDGVEFVRGGETRQLSVFNALQALRGRAECVAVHDGARPFIDLESLKEVVNLGRECGAAILAERITATLKKIDLSDQLLETVERERYVLAQTPQVFHAELIYRAHLAVGENLSSCTDDSQLVEKLGVAVKVIINDKPNPKITSPADLIVAQGLAGQNILLPLRHSQSAE